MSYEVGTHIDLTKLNKTVESAVKVVDKPTAFEVGTQILFNMKDSRMVAERRINVVFA